MYIWLRMPAFLMSQGKLRNLSTLSRLVSKGKKTSTVISNYVPEKVYELRTYEIKPKAFKSYVNLTNQYIHLRTKHSKLVGFWSSELGKLNQTIHIWEYDSLEHRAKVRKDLAADTDWFDTYLSKIGPMLHRQDNLVMTLLPCCFIEIPARLGVYELMKFSMNGASRSHHKEYEDFITAAKTMYEEHSSSLIGCFETDYGPNNTMICLWQHDSFDSAATAKRELWQNSSVVGLPFTKRMRSFYNIGMLPLAISPML